MAQTRGADIAQTGRGGRPRLPRGYFAETGRGGAAASKWIFQWRQVAPRLRYAPPDLRGKGYAAALVRATTADLLTRPPGFAAVVVAAPALDAPTAPQKTGLWTRAGYRHVGDTAEFAFEAAPAPEPAPAAEVSSGLSALKMS